jgi:gamma-glutamyltranspeptidase / glutathione hydrolase
MREEWDEPSVGAPAELAPGPALPRPVRARSAIGFALAVPRRDLILASLLLCVPLVGWAALHGWLAELARRMHKNSPSPLPALRASDLWVHARNGVGAWAIAHGGGLALLFAAGFLAVLANAGALLALALGGQLWPLVWLALLGLSTVTLIAVGTLVLDAALIRTELSAGAVEAVTGAWRHSRGSRARTLAAYARFFPLALGTLLTGALLCGVGIVPAFALVQIAALHLRAQLARDRARRGAPMLPARAPALLPSERRRIPRLPAASMALIALAACTPSPSVDGSEPASPSAGPAAAKSASVPARIAAREPQPTLDPGPPIVIRGGGTKAVRGEHGLVTSVEAHATRAGVRVLEQGGNAVDAAVAVGYALAVTHPSAGNIGGGGFMLVRMTGGPTIAIDFRETAPSGLTQQAFDEMIADGALGPAAVGVPGTPAGLNLAHGRFGKLALRQVMEPAIELAKKGHRVGARQGQTIGWAWPELRKDAAARAIFGDGDRAKKPGAWLRQPDLAAVLERIAHQGDAGFYRGPTADALVRALAPAKLMTSSDLADYRARVREPLITSYRGLRVEIMPPPSAGGVALAQTLGILERNGAARLTAGSAESLHLFIEASRRAHAEKRFAVLDPEALPPDVLSARRREWLDVDALIAKTPPIDRTRATPSADVHPLYAAAMRELDQTTHYSVVDGDGNVVSCTTTLSAGFGARMVAAGTGIVLNNSVAAFGTAGENLPAPRRRTTSSMAPTLVLRQNQVVLVLGSPGGDTIPSTIAQVLRNVVDHGMTIDSAIDAGRIHHGFVPDLVRYEAKRPVPRSVLEQLQSLGHRFSHKRLPIGDANDVLIADGVAYGYADPREGGLALAAAAPSG